MQDTNVGIQRFLNACNEMITGKFILADRKVGELLKAVASSEELTKLFAAVTDGFDFAKAKASYLRFPAQPHASRGAAYLPTERKEILAFVFCLLVEFDSGKLNFNDFLLRYFYEDGSYTASYAIFVGRMIRPFRDIVRDCYPDFAENDNTRFLRQKEDEVWGALYEKISIERTRLSMQGLPREDAVAGEMILAELYAATGRKDSAEVKALLCGYLYFLGAVGCADENSSEIFNLAAEL